MKDATAKSLDNAIPIQWPDRGVMEITGCAVEGCRGRAMGGRYCARCTEEIEALDAMASAAEAQELVRLWNLQERRERWERRIEPVWEILIGLSDWARKVDWTAVALVAASASAISYLAWEFVNGLAQ